jgi:hypothetical protein
LIVGGFIALLKVAVTSVLEHALAAVRGVTEITVGAVNSGFAPGLQHPELKMSSRNVVKQIVGLLYLRMTVILFLSPSLPRLLGSNSQTNLRRSRTQGLRSLQMDVASHFGIPVACCEGVHAPHRQAFCRAVQPYFLKVNAVSVGRFFRK